MHAVGEAPAGAPSAEDALAAVRDRLHRASEVARSNAKRFWIATKESHARLLAERDPAAESAEPLDGRDGEPARALVVGVCGMSCSGKSTVVAGLRAQASQHGNSLPVLCLDDFFHEWMFDACEASMEAHPESVHVPSGSDGRRWKNWEAGHCIDWGAFVDELRRQIARQAGTSPLVVVEGFLLLDRAEVCALLDECVCIRVSKEVAWRRRLARAISMASGQKDASGMDNYEVIGTYAIASEHEAVRADAGRAVERAGADVVYPSTDGLSGARGAYDWLRLYFDEVVWPFAEAAAARVDEIRGEPRPRVHMVDGDAPVAEVDLATRRIVAAVSAQPGSRGRAPGSTAPCHA